MNEKTNYDYTCTRCNKKFIDCAEREWNNKIFELILRHVGGFCDDCINKIKEFGGI